jgi:hypothetical protein
VIVVGSEDEAGCGSRLRHFSAHATRTDQVGGVCYWLALCAEAAADAVALHTHW